MTLKLFSFLILMSLFVGPFGQAEECNPPEKIKISNLDRASKPTQAKISMGSDDSEFHVKDSNFHLLSTGQFDVLSFLGIGFYIGNRTLVYVCATLGEPRPEDNKIEIIFYEGFPETGMVERRPLPVTWNPLQSSQTFIERIFGGLPGVGGWITKLVRVQDHVQSGLTKAFSSVQPVGVERVILTSGEVEIRTGIGTRV